MSALFVTLNNGEAARFRFEGGELDGLEFTPAALHNFIQIVMYANETGSVEALGPALNELGCSTIAG